MLTTGSGDVELLTHDDARVSVRTGSGDIEVIEGEGEADFSERYANDGTVGLVQVRTGSGDIRIRMPA